MSGGSIEGGVLRVKALQAARRRAGLAFTREPRDLAPGELGDGLAAVVALAAILADPQLHCLLVVDGEEREITEEEREDLAALVGAEQARVDPDNLPTSDAAEAVQTQAGETAKTGKTSKPRKG